MCRSVQLLIWRIKLLRFRSKFKEGSLFCLAWRTDAFCKGPLQDLEIPVSLGYLLLFWLAKQSLPETGV